MSARSRTQTHKGTAGRSSQGTQAAGGQAVSAGKSHRQPDTNLKTLGGFCNQLVSYLYCEWIQTVLPLWPREAKRLGTAGLQDGPWDGDPAGAQGQARAEP